MMILISNFHPFVKLFLKQMIISLLKYFERLLQKNYKFISKFVYKYKKIY
jgi:hypothetical protein